MIYGSVCSGIEAASVAWDPLGWERAFVSEVDKFANQVLRCHYPDTSNLGDFTTIEANERTAAIDVLVGGTPCQSFSVAGLRKGMADPRGNLTLGYCRLLDRLKPDWFVWENVPGILSSNEGRDFGAFLGAVEKLGYEWAYRILDAQHFGVPQRRRRVFVVGHFRDWRYPPAVLFERESLQGRASKSSKKRKGPAAFTPSSFGKYRPGIGTIREAGGDLGGGSETLKVTGPIPASGAGTSRTGNARNEDTFLVPYRCQAFGQYTEGEKGSAIKARDGKQSASDVVVFNARQDTVHSETTTGAVDTDGGTNAVAFSVNQRREGRLRDNHAYLNGDKSGTQLDGVITAGFMAGQSKASGSIGYESEMSPTIRGAGSGTNQVPTVQNGLRVRRLTPVECERLQGFPDGYTEAGIDTDDNEVTMSDTRRYKLLGNSFAVPVVRWIGERIETVESIAKTHDA